MNAMTINDPSGIRSVSSGQLPEHGREASQHNETSVKGRLGENHGGVERPMDPVSCRTPDEFPADMNLLIRGCRGQIRNEEIKNLSRPYRTAEAGRFARPVIHRGGIGMAEKSGRSYHEMLLDSRILEVPRNTYQRELSPERVRRISENFDERIANEPKVSRRNGRYYVFDGQHVLAARIVRNNGDPLPVRCRLFTGLDEKEEALLFANQSGFSASPGIGMRLRAKVFAGEAEACLFLKTTEEAGVRIDYGQHKGRKRLACIAAALTEFRKLGPEKYRDALEIILESWDGDADSLRAETLTGICRFVDLYAGEYDRKRLVKRFRSVDPMKIYRDGRMLGDDMPGYKKYLYQVLRIYNGSSRKSALPVKF